MRYRIGWLIQFIFFVLAGMSGFFVYTKNINGAQLLEGLNLTGYLRNRFWGFYSSIPFPDSSLTKNYISYFDIFLRSRFRYSVFKGITIQVVLDIYTIYGQSSGGLVETRGGSLGRPGFNIATRNLFVSIRPIDTLQIQLGLLPFSLPGGYILAKDGAGLKVRYAPDIPFVNLYFFWVKAIENSLTSADESGLEPQELRDDDLYILGNNINIDDWLLSEIYYIFRNDLNQADFDSGRLHWLGLSTDGIWGDFQAELTLAYNFGNVKPRSGSEPITISSALWGLYLGYEIGNFTLGIRDEGATGANAKEPYTKDAFQTIGASRGLSKILADNSGGLAIRRGGTLYGINSVSLELSWKYSANLQMGFKAFYFLLLNKLTMPSQPASASRNLGGEINLSLDYRFYANLELNHTFGIFYPLQGYYNWVGHTPNNEPIIEILIGLRVPF